MGQSSTKSFRDFSSFHLKDSLSLSAPETSSGPSAIGPFVMEERKCMGFGGRFHLQGLEVLYVASSHIPLAGTQSSHVAAPNDERSWEI